jgi:pseudaminic acid synthase
VKLQDIKIGGYSIGIDKPPMIIAEMSGNHNQSLDKALELIDMVAESGAHALKIQTYTPDTLTIDISQGEFLIDDPKSLWFGRNLYELYQEAHTPWEWHEAIFERAKKKNILCFSTPFDDSAVDFLEKFDVPAYKIASFENNHLPLLKKVAKTGKPVILSTGISTLSNLEDAVSTLRQNGCRDIILLKCTSTYPATPENSNLKTIPHLSELFNCHVGLSDHTLGTGVSVASVALGARIIEKHFTLNRLEGGVDAAFSMEPNEFKLLVEETHRAYLSLGTVQYGIQQAELKSINFKRSVYIVADMKKGEKFTKDNIRIIRPGLGLEPKLYEIVIGRVVNIDVKRGTPLSLNLIS